MLTCATLKCNNTSISSQLVLKTLTAALRWDVNPEQALEPNSNYSYNIKHQKGDFVLQNDPQDAVCSRCSTNSTWFLGHVLQICPTASCCDLRCVWQERLLTDGFHSSARGPLIINRLAKVCGEVFVRAWYCVRRLTEGDGEVECLRSSHVFLKEFKLQLGGILGMRLSTDRG